MDIAATNFDVTVDNECCKSTDECCCEYPSFNLQLSHKVGEGNLSLGDSATYDSIQYFKIIDAKFYLSNFSLVQNDGTQFQVQDTIELYKLDNVDTISFTVIDDFALIDRRSSNPFSITLGDFRDAGTVDSVRFLLGLDTESNQAIPEKVEDTHPLSLQDDSMYWDSSNGFIFSKIRIVKDIALGDTTTYEIGQSNGPILIGLSCPKTIEFGFDADVSIEIDYAEWFQGINFAIDSDSDIQSKIVNNLSNAFQIID